MADVLIAGSGDEADAGKYDVASYFYLRRKAAALSGIGKSIRVKVAGSENIMVAIYSDVGGSPSSRLAFTGSTAVVAGWNTIPIADVPMVAGTYYWLASNNGSSFQLKKDYGTVTPTRFKSATYSTFSFPDPVGGGFTSTNSSDACIAVWGTVGGASVGLIGDALIGERVLFGSEIFFG